MEIPTRPLAALLAISILSSASPAADADAAKLGRQPHEFAIVFNMGYANDALPNEPEEFEKLVVATKQAGYNVILCKHEDWRIKILAEHGMKIMVDLLVSDHHVYKNTEAAEKLCRSLRDSKSVYAYHLWSDGIGGQIAGRSRDVKNIHAWDPNHPSYVGSKSGREIGGLQEADLIGYYDFHWKRGGFWSHLNRMMEAAKKTDSFFLKYTDGAPGRPGVGNYNRVLYTISMSVAFGMKGYMFHYTGGEIDQKSWKWSALGNDLAKVNAEFAKLGPELMKIGNPRAVYSAPITKTAKDRPTGADKPTVPDGLAPVPADSWLQIKSGEAVIGVFQDQKQRDALVLANHNAYQPQAMEIEFAESAKVKAVVQLDRETGKWQKLPLVGRVVKFTIAPAAAELLLVDR